MTNADTNDKTATVAEQGTHLAPEKAPAEKSATRKKGETKGQKTAKAGKNKAPKKSSSAGKNAVKPTTAKKGGSPRAESKCQKILEMTGRAKGATLDEIMNANGWQAHSVRGFLSSAAKKHRLKIESSKNEAGERLYKTGK